MANDEFHIILEAHADTSPAQKELEEFRKKQQGIDLKVDGSSADIATASIQKMNTTAQQSASIFGKLRSAISNTFSAGKLAMTGYLAVLRELNQTATKAKDAIEDIDQAVTDLQIATDATRESTEKLVSTYNEHAKRLKVTTTAVTDAANDYLRAGKSLGEAQTLINDSVMLAKLGNLNEADATEDLLSVMNGYEMSIDGVNHALDAMVSIDMRAATSAGDIAEAMRYSAASANVAEVSFDKLAAMIATVADKTQLSSSVVGNFFNTMLSRYRDVKIGNYLSEDGEDISDYESVLKSIGVQLRDSQGEFRSFEDVLQDLANKWDTLTSAQENALIKVAAGTRMSNRFVSLMEGYNKTLELTEVAANSAGTAIEKYNNAYLTSLEAKQSNLQASFESMVMGTDLDTVYGDILDATTAMVDFINETNALKGAFAGLTVGAGIKTFLSLKTGIHEAYIQLNQFQNALQMTKQTNLSTADFDRLIVLSNNLSTSQTKLLLSSKNLTFQQKQQILMAQGLSAEEAKLQLQTWGMTTANTGLTAATTSLSTAFKGLWSTLVSNPLLVVTAAISGAVMAYQSYTQNMEEARQKAEEAAGTYEQSAKSVDEYVKRYKELHSALLAAKGDEAETYNIKSQLLDLQTELNNAFGEETGKINLLTNAYEDQTEALLKYNKVAAQTYLNENREIIGAAVEEMTEQRHYYLSGTGLSAIKKDSAIGQAVQEVAIKYKDEGVSVEEDATGNTIQIYLNSDAETAYDTINSFANDVRVLAEQMGDDHIFDSILDISSTSLNKSKEVIEEWGTIYRQSMLAEITSSETLAAGYNEAVKAVESYNNAVAQSDDPYNDANVQTARQNLAAVKASIQDNKAEWGRYSAVVEDVFAGVDTSLFDFHDAIKTNSDGIGELAGQLRGLDDIDLQAMLADNNEDAFDKLVDAAESYGLTVEEVIDTLVRLGIVQGQVVKTSDTVASTLDYSKLADTAETATEAYDIMTEAISTMVDAFAEQAEHGSLSLDTMMKLVQAGYAGALAYNEETGACTVNAQAVYEMTKAKIQAQIADLKLLQTNIAEKLEADGMAALGSATGFISLAKAKSIAASADQLNAVDDYNQAQAEIIALENALKNFDKVAAGTYSTTAKNVSSTISKASTDYKAMLDKEISSQEAAFNAGLMDFQTYINKRLAIIEEYYQDGRIQAADYYAYLGDTYQEQLGIYDKVLAAVKRRIDAEIEGVQTVIDGIKAENEALEGQLDEYNGILSVIESVYQTQIDNLRAEQDLLDEDIAKLREANDEREKALRLEKAQEDLARAKQQRTKMIYTAESGFIYDTDQTAIKEAQDNLTELQTELETDRMIEALEAEKSALDKAIVEIQKYIDAYNQIPNKKQEAINRQLAIEMLGADYEQAILSGRIEDVEAFAEKYLAVQQRIDDNTALIESNEQKIEEYERLKEQYTQIADVYEQSVEDQYAAMVMGQDWESKVLSGRLDVLDAFRTEYVSIQEAIANAAWESANAQIAAAKEAEKAAAGVQNQNVVVLDELEEVVSGGGSHQHRGYTNQVLAVSKFSQGGVVSDDDANILDPIARKAGEDHFALVQNDEVILPKDDPIAKVIRGESKVASGTLSPAQQWLYEHGEKIGYNNSIGMVGLKDSGYKPILPPESIINNNQKVITNNNDINITMNGVNDGPTFAKVVKQQIHGILSQTD